MHNPQDISVDPAAKAEKYLADITGKSWEQLYQNHIADYAALFDRVSIELGGETSAGNKT